MHKIIITLRDGSIEIKKTAFDWEAQIICEEEIKWEQTARVICETIAFDQSGEFIK